MSVYNTILHDVGEHKITFDIYKIDHEIEPNIKISYLYDDKNINILETTMTEGFFIYNFPKKEVQITIKCNCKFKINFTKLEKKYNLNEQNNLENILLIIDSYGWAFDNIGKKIKHYSTNYNVTIITFFELFKIIKNNKLNFFKLSHILFFWYSGTQNKQLLDYFYNLKYFYDIKTINLCVYDYSKWINNNISQYFDDMSYFFDKIDNYLYGCDLINDNLIKYFNYKIMNNKIKNYKISDGVDHVMFPFVGYNEDIYTKKQIIVGWIGNSDPLMHGINKGFKLLKEHIKKHNDKFIFNPLDTFTSNTKIPHEEVYKYISSVDIIICFSMYEGTPNQILEASSCGKCWISTNVGIVEELQKTNKNKQCGIIINRTEEDLLKALNICYNNRDLLVKYGKNGRDNILQNWTWENRSKQFHKVFSYSSTK